MRTHVRASSAFATIRPALSSEAGFTLLEVMIAIVLLTIGLLATASTFPSLMAEALYGKDQTRAANLAQQQMEVYRNTATPTLAGRVGNYGTVASQYFDQNVTTTTPAAAYFTRDVQIQYWPWSTSLAAFVTSTTPYTAPSGNYMFRVSVTTHWLVHGQTAYTTGTPSGCVVGGVAVSVGLGCITIGTFVAP